MPADQPLESHTLVEHVESRRTGQQRVGGPFSFLIIGIPALLFLLIMGAVVWKVSSFPSNPPVISSFTVEPQQVVAGQEGPIHLSWVTARARMVVIEPGVGAVEYSGSRYLPAPSEDTVYTLLVYGDGQEVRAQVRVSVTGKVGSD